MLSGGKHPRPIGTGAADQRVFGKHVASKSGRLPMIILQRPAQPFAADNFPGLLVRLLPWLQDLMVKSSVRSCAMIMKEETVRSEARLVRT
jgi:hypothetical protein